MYFQVYEYTGRFMDMCSFLFHRFLIRVLLFMIGHFMHPSLTQFCSFFPRRLVQMSQENRLGVPSGLKTPVNLMQHLRYSKHVTCLFTPYLLSCNIQNIVKHVHLFIYFPTLYVSFLICSFCCCGILVESRTHLSILTFTMSLFCRTIIHLLLYKLTSLPIF